MKYATGLCESVTGHNGPVPRVCGDPGIQYEVSGASFSVFQVLCARHAAEALKRFVLRPVKADEEEEQCA